MGAAHRPGRSPGTRPSGRLRHQQRLARGHSRVRSLPLPTPEASLPTTTPTTPSLTNDIAEVLINEAQIKQRVAELGAAINKDFAGEQVLIIAVLKGALLFLADLMRHVDLPLAVDFLAVSSYGAGTQSSGVVRILKDLDESIEHRNVIIVEDIVDSGRTLDYLLRMLRQRHPATLHVCTLLDKRDRREIDVPIDYVGFEVPDAFVVGYGLDYGEHYRQLPFIGVLKPEIYQ
ncbi:MAG: hypoxanthine phosphoribosyltransferase [Anaerolinea sp.]|nr:hypoxanthine phosphoribosyltransferase [Anaerolinea sp.]